MRTKTVNIIGITSLIIAIGAVIYVQSNSKNNTNIYNQSVIDGKNQADEFVDSVESYHYNK